jgi:hypothetical protein
VNKITNIVIALVCLLMVSANAQAEVQKRIWIKATNAENLPLFQEILGKNKFDVTEADILSKHLGDAAWEVAKNGHYLDLVDPKHRSKDAYSKKFLAFAFLNQPGDVVPERITWDYIKKKGQGDIGWRLPVKKSETVVLLQQLQASERKILDSQQAQNEKLNNLDVTAKALDVLVNTHSETISVQGGQITGNQKGLQSIKTGTFTEAMLVTVSTEVEKAVGGRVAYLKTTVSDQLTLITENSENIAIQGKKVPTLFVIVGLALLLVVYLAWMGKKQDVKTKAHEVALNGDGTDGNSGLVGKVAKLDQSFASMEEKLQETNTAVIEVQRDMEEVEKAPANRVLSKIVWDDKNASLEVLAELSGGRTGSVVWVFTYENEAYKISFWRNADALKDQVRTDILRDAKYEELVGPIAIKRLKVKIAAALRDGRIKPRQTIMVAA